MHGPGAKCSFTGLRDLWGRWTGIVELYARQLPREGRVDPRSYRELHQELLATCKTLADNNKNGGAGLVEDLRYLAQPWLTLWVLQQTDREILLDLLNRCQAAHHQLGGRPLAWLKRPLRWCAGFTICAATAGIAVWLIQPRWVPIAEWLDDQWRMMSFSARHRASWEWILLIGVLGIVAAMFAVSRTAGRR
jgi:hypothetical protein